MCLLAKFFNGFANSTRLSILLLLTQRGEMKVGELVKELGAPQPRVSDHLRCLSWCGYVEVRREGRNAYYSVADERVLEVLKLGSRCYGTTSSTSRLAMTRRRAARDRSPLSDRRRVALSILDAIHPRRHVRVVVEGDLAPLLELAQPNEVAGVSYVGQRELIGEVVATF